MAPSRFDKISLFIGQKRRFELKEHWSTMDKKGLAIGPGQYLMIGRKDDDDQEVYAVIDDLAADADLRTLCSRTLLEIGRNDPMSFNFSTLLFALPSGGVRVALNRMTLERYVYVNYAT